MIHKARCLFVVSMIITVSSIAMSQPDSLFSVLNKTKGYDRISVLKEIGVYYMDYDFDSTLLFLNKALKLANENQDIEQKAHIYRAIGKAHSYYGSLEDGIKYTQLSIKNYVQTKDFYNTGLSYNNLGIFYSYLAKDDTSIYFHKKAFIIFKSINDTTQIVETLNNIGTAFYYKTEYDSAAYYLKEAEALLNGTNDNRTKGAVYNNFGLLYQATGKLEDAINGYIKAVDYFELEKDIRVVSIINNNIGTLYIELGFYEKAKKLFKAKAEYDMSVENMAEYAKSLSNIGICYSNMGRQDSALLIYLDASKIADSIENIDVKGLVYKNTGDTYYILEQYENALTYFKKAEKYRLAENKPFELAMLYNSFGDLYTELKEFDKAIIYLEKSEQIGLEHKSYQVILKSLISIANIAFITGNFEKSAIYYEKYISYKDSFINESVQNQISDLETKYQTEKKEQQLELQNIELKQQEAQIARKKAEQNIYIVGLSLMFILAIVIFRSYRQKRKSNIVIREKNKILEQANEEISAQRDEIEAQRDFANQQKELIEGQNIEIKGSIRYAKRIQAAILPEIELLEKNLSGHFIFYKPRDIVSGDFYWFSEIENHLVIAVADCTGHGVPGAFMSMLGAAFLNEIVNKEYITHPGVILRKLRKQIINALQQKGGELEQKDGMDIALISINLETKMCQFAGANNPLYIVSGSDMQVPAGANIRVVKGQGQQLYEIKGDKMPIAIYEKMDRFTTHEIQLNSKDQIYMFSDGYADQFGGPKAKKLKYKAFKENILKNADMPMTNQITQLGKTFEGWKGALDQVDDVLLLGIKI